MKYRLLAFFFFFPFLFATAQRYGFINYNVENGLAQSQVNAIGQDHKGYLWFATNGGASRFDGNSFINYYSGNGLLSNQVNVVHVDKSGRVWLGTLGGLNLVEEKKIITIPFDNSLSQYSVKTIVEDKNGLLWIGTDGGGLVSYDVNNKNYTYYQSAQGLPTGFIRTLCFDDKDRLWIGTKRGLGTMVNGKFEVSPIVDTKTDVSSLAFANGKLWICTLGSGVYCAEREVVKQYTDKEHGLIESWIKSVTIDAAGNQWFSSAVGLCKYNGQKFTHFKEKQGLEHVNINSTFIDKEGSLWLATEASGVYRFCGEGIVTFSVEDGLGENIVMAVTQTKNSGLWLGTYGGGAAFQKQESFVSLEIPDGVSQNYVYSCLADKDDNIFLGTELGLYKYNGKKFQSFTSNQNIGEGTILTLLQDSKGYIWVGTTNGLLCFDAEFNEVYTSAQKPKTAIYKIYEDKNSVIWFAAEAGVISFDGHAFKNHYQGKVNTPVFNVAGDKAGNLWFGSSEGFKLYNHKDFKTVTLSDNFSSNQIMSVVIDEENILWAATNNGIYYFNVDEYLTSGNLNISQIGKQQGLKSIECNQNAIYTDNRGKIFIGTTAGLVQIDKKIIKPGKEVLFPMLNLTGIRLFLQDADWKPYSDSINTQTGLPVNLKVDYRKNHLTFDFVGILLGNPDNVRYKFMLEGFDGDWSPFTKETFATYSNLSYGEYKFKVALTDERGVFLNTPPVEFSFIITPPFWKTWWFTFLVFVFLSILGWIIYRWRWAVVKRKREAQQLVYKSKLMALEQETLNASLNRHFIFNALNSIQYYINRQDRLAANKYLTSFAKLIRKNLDSSQNNLVSLSEELERLELYLSLEHMRFSKFSYQIKIADDVDPDAVKIPPMILQPYVENSIWHGILPMEGDGKILVEIKKTDEKTIVFIIEDNGIGIDESMRKKQEFPTEHDSKGMKITETRIKLLRKMTGGNIEIKGPYDIKNEGNGTGTRVEIILPIKK